jgi:transcriptional regulator PpsR
MESVLLENKNSLLENPLLESDGVFEGLDKASVLTLLNQIADVSLRIDADGKVAQVTVSDADLDADFDASWIGKTWIDTVKEESRARIRELLAQTSSSGQAQNWHDIIHQRADGSELPISYFTVRAGEGDGLVAIGRDLRAVSALRQQLVNAQIALEKDYWRLRQVETRYRLVFQMVDEAVLLVDESTEKILEANDGASRGLAQKGASIVGKSLITLFDENGAKSVRELLSETRVVGRGAASGIRAADGVREFTINANLLKQETE